MMETLCVGMPSPAEPTGGQTTSSGPIDSVAEDRRFLLT
jgi:hypothetical protein